MQFDMFRQIQQPESSQARTSQCNLMHAKSLLQGLLLELHSEILASANEDVSALCKNASRLS